MEPELIAGNYPQRMESEFIVGHLPGAHLALRVFAYEPWMSFSAIKTASPKLPVCVSGRTLNVLQKQE